MAEQTDREDVLARILADPEIRAAAEEREGEQEPATEAAALPSLSLPPELLGKLPMLMGALGPMMQGKDGAKDEKSALLLALKPYMSPQRCDAIDKLIMINRLSDLMRRMH